MVYTKKAISPVVATALLLVVAVVAVVGFQTWFTSYQSDLNSKVEVQSDSGSALTVERLEAGSGATATVYARNFATSSVSITEMKIMKDGTTHCTNSTAVNASASDVKTLTTNCTSSGGALTRNTAYDVVLITSSGVYTSTMVAK